MLRDLARPEPICRSSTSEGQSTSRNCDSAQNVPTITVRIAAILVFAAAIGVGCATTPRPEVEGSLASITPEQARVQEVAGARVRWGGTILEVKPEKAETCFEILSRELDSSGRPRDTDANYGRFIACADGFYDPAVYTRNRELTVVGTVAEAKEGKIGEHAYRFARLKAEKLYLWPKQEYFAPLYYDPYWGWYDPFWGWPYSFYRRPFPYRPYW
jgi:outer membrane lipoprotein